MSPTLRAALPSNTRPPRIHRPILVCLTMMLGICSAGEIHGIVESSAGTPIPSARIAFVGIGRKAGGRDTTASADGSFAIRDMPPGLYWAQASAKGYQTVITGPVQVLDGTSAFVGATLIPAPPFDLAISDRSTLSGIVLAPSGPLAGALVCGQKSAATPTPKVCAVTDLFGFYGIVTSLGDWRITVESGGRTIWLGTVAQKSEGDSIRHIVIGK